MAIVFQKIVCRINANSRIYAVAMRRPLSFAPGLRARLSGFGIDWQVQEHIANHLAEKLRDYTTGTAFGIAHLGLLFDIRDFVAIDFRFAANPHEFDAEGCQER